VVSWLVMFPSTLSVAVAPGSVYVVPAHQAWKGCRIHHDQERCASSDMHMCFTEMTAALNQQQSCQRNEVKQEPTQDARSAHMRRNVLWQCLHVWVAQNGKHA